MTKFSGIADAGLVRHGGSALFDPYGYAVSGDSCPVGYVRKCVPEDLFVPSSAYKDTAISSASGKFSAETEIEVGGGGLQGGFSPGSASSVIDSAGGMFRAKPPPQCYNCLSPFLYCYLGKCKVALPG